MARPKRGNGGPPDPLDGLRSFGSHIQQDADEPGGHPPINDPQRFAGLDALGAEFERTDRTAEGGGRHARRKRHRRWRRWVLAGLAVVLVLVAAGAGYLYYLTHDLQPGGGPRSHSGAHHRARRPEPRTS